MTCVVFAAGQMAADSVVVAGGTRVGATRKIVRAFGNVAGASGCCVAVAQFLDQVERGQVENFALNVSDQGFSGLLVLADGALHRVGAEGQPFPLACGFAAIGSGSDIALGALHMGATAPEAVEAAIAFDTDCGGPVQIERLDNGAIRPASVKRRKAA